MPELDPRIRTTIARTEIDYFLRISHSLAHQLIEAEQVVQDVLKRGRSIASIDPLMRESCEALREVIGRLWRTLAATRRIASGEHDIVRVGDLIADIKEIASLV